MPLLVVHGAVIRCDAGAAPVSLVAPRRVARTGPPLATVADHTPSSITSFAMCRSQANPSVAAATAAAGGAPTPAACQPNVPTPWTPGTKNVTVANPPKRRLRALTSDSTCSCAFGGTIEVVEPMTRVRVD